jgi:hypothetical protein
MIRINNIARRIFACRKLAGLNAARTREALGGQP